MLIPLALEDCTLTGFHRKNNFYFDKCLRIGASSACNMFESFSDAIMHILKEKFQVSHVVKVLDDFLLVHPTEEGCEHAIDSFIALTELIGVSLAEMETVRPTKVLTFLGVEIDSCNMQTALPEDKVNDYPREILILQELSHTNLRKFRSVMGKLAFATCVMTARRRFLRRINNATIGKTKPLARVEISQDIEEDLRIWTNFLTHFNGKTIYAGNISLFSQDLNFFSDSSFKGFGATFLFRFIVGTFPKH